MGIPRLNVGENDGDEESKDLDAPPGRSRDPATTVNKPKAKRRMSDSSRGSIGRKERLRNALTGRSDGSGDGADQPKELPEEEFQDFLLRYDRTDTFCRKIVKQQVARDGDSSDENPMGEIGDDYMDRKSKKSVKTVDSIEFPSLDEALNEPFDLNNITTMAQRLRNLNCQPRETKHLYPAPFLLLAKRDKRCKDCNKIIIKPNMDPKSNEKIRLYCFS